MKMTRLSVLFLLIVALVSTSAETLNINVTTEGPRKGVIAILVFKDQKGFPNKDDKAFLKARFPITEEGPVACTITNLPYGTYAVSVLHDINDNYKADKMLGFGPPKEPVGISNRQKKMLKQPKFKDALFEFNVKTNTIAVPAFFVF
jgi:uncharacterized protein (DUF2141 family)